MSKLIGLAAIVLGLIGLAWGGFSYTTREKVIDVGPIHATRDQSHYLAVPPVAGALLIIAGAVIMITGKKV